MPRLFARQLRVAVLATGAFVCVLAPAWSQEFTTIERGIKPERAFELGEVDQVRLFNGGLTMSIPIGQSYPVGLGSELTYQLTLTYSNQVWDYISAKAPIGHMDETVTQAWPGRVFNAGLGWRLSLGEYWDSTVSGPGRCGECYIGPDGAQHPLYQTLHPDVADDSTNTLYTRDGTYLRLRRNVREIDFPNGEIHRFDTQGRLIQIRDRFGNTVNVTHGASSWTINDGTRTQTVNMIDVAHYGKAVGSVVLRSFGGTTATYSFQYAQPQVHRSCIDNDPETSASLQVPILTQVTLPDGSTYSMPQSKYDLVGSPGPCDRLDFNPATEGLIEEIKLPTRGKISWTYQAFNFPTPIEGQEGDDPLYLQKTTGVRNRVMRNAGGSALGTWTYTQVLPGGQNAVESITQVQSPLGDRTDYYFKVGDEPDPLYGLPVSPLETAPGRPDLMRSVKVYDCNGSGGGCALKRTTYLKYRTDSPFPGGPEFNPRVEREYVLFHDDNNRWIATDRSSFDGLGHYRIETTSSNIPGGTNRTVRTNFNPTRGTYPGSFVMPTTGSPWVLETYDYRHQQEGSKTFRTDYCFDTNNGFLKRVRVREHTGGAIGANDLLVTFDRVGGATRTITEKYYGGDLTPVGTSTNLCGMGLGTDAFRVRNRFRYGSLYLSEHLNPANNAVVLIGVNRTIDPNTGLVSSEHDTALVKTDFKYDKLARITERKPAQDAWIRYTYTAPTSGSARVHMRSYNAGSFSTLLTDEEILFDDFGRVFRERRRMPGNFWARRTTRYNALSQVTDVSAWQADTNNTMWTKFRNYDPFGRPGFIDPPEGSSHRVSFTYTGVRVIHRTSKVGTHLSNGSVGESTVAVSERYDRHGRLYQLIDGSSTTTTYTYDPAGNLTRVSRPGQSRTFNYDGRGFLTFEILPEKGGAGNGRVDYSRFDARGNVGRRSDGPMSVDYVYDKASRLLTTRIPGGANLKVYAYGNGTSTGDRSRGKIKTADRYNYVMLGTTPYTVQVRETYTYGGRSGRPSRRVTQTWVNGAAVESFTQAWNGYDMHGNVTSLSYPQCTHSGCSSPSPRTVSFTYDNSKLRTVGGWASLWYHHNGLLQSVTHTNGVTVTQTNDPWSRPLPRAIATSGALNTQGTASANWNSGTYVYDGMGNVTQIGSSRMIYDALSRLKSATLTTSLNGNVATNRSQTFAYDGPGNRISTTTNGVTINTPASSSTNRLTGAVAYDAGGNMTGWNGNTYQYDRFGKMWRMKAGAKESIYIYTADDERIWSFHVGENRSTWTLRDLGGKVLREYHNNAGSWRVDRDYVYRDGQLVGAFTAFGNRHFHLDHLGTPRLVTNASRRQVGYYVYYPYGEQAIGPPIDGERMKFTGHERDLNATGGANPTADDLDYMHARFYNPQLGRFLSVDPGRDIDPGVPQSWNLYAYSRNNPAKYIDRDGEAIETAWDAFNVGLGVVSLVDNIRNRRFGAALLDAGGIVVDSLATAVPVVPGGAGTAIKAGRAADTAVTFARGVDRANDARRAKAVNLPAWKKVKVDTEHISSGHLPGGSRVSANKDLFPEMSAQRLEKVVREAYRRGKRVKTQGERVLVRGEADGMTIELWVNLETKVIETAYPVFRGIGHK